MYEYAAGWGREVTGSKAKCSALNIKWQNVTPSASTQILKSESQKQNIKSQSKKIRAWRGDWAGESHFTAKAIEFIGWAGAAASD